MLNQLGLSIINTQEYGPESIEASYDAPWMQLLNDVGGWIVGTVIVVGVILVAIAAIIFASSKASGASRGQEVGIQALLWIGVVMAVVGSAGGVIAWAAGLDLGF